MCDWGWKGRGRYLAGSFSYFFFPEENLFVLFSTLTLSLPNYFSSAKFLVCFNIQSASMSLKVCENVVWVSNSLDLGETQSYSASHPDPSCLHMAL